MDFRLGTEYIPRVVVLVASFNGEDFLRRQLDTIFSQVGVDVNVLISDDCSNDDTLRIVQEFKNRGAPIKILSEGHKFGSAGRNFLSMIKTVRLETYDYVAFSDQDDIWAPDKLIFAIKALRFHKVGGFSSSVEAYWPDSGKLVYVDKASPQTDVDHWFESPGPGCSQVFTAAAFSKFQRFLFKQGSAVFDVDYHDWLIYAYFKHNSLGWYISPVSKMKYVQHSRNQIGANSGLEAVFSRIRFVWSGWYRQQIELIYRTVTGRDRRLVGSGFLVRNFLRIRRNTKYSIFLSILLFLRFG